MDYRGWVLSIYDEYKKRYSERYEPELSICEMVKKIIKNAFKRENIFPFLTIMLYLILITTLFVLLPLKVITAENFFTALAFGTLVYLLCFSPYMYRYEPDLESYNRRIEMLREVLKEQNIYNKEVIVGLKNYTGNIFFKLGNFTINVLIAAGFSAGIGELFRRLDKEFFTYAVATMIVAVPTIFSVYSILTAIPNNRIVRRKNFHQILKILLTNDFEGRSIVIEENKANNVEQLKEKEIVKTIVKALSK